MKVKVLKKTVMNMKRKIFSGFLKKLDGALSWTMDLISTIKLHQNGEKDLLGRVYEYFLGQFASAEGKGGGEFYTPTSIVKDFS
ncbi:N-6 DNA methylase [Vallitalea pronyensis]